jgi:hypothetical protein
MTVARAVAPVLEDLKGALGFASSGAVAGNLTVGKGVLDGRPVRVALVENRIASGSIGRAEVAKLVPLMGIAVREQAPLVLYLDSAGTRVSEALEALGAFRRLFRDTLAARLAGVPIAVVLGKNCFGGASLLAYLGRRRLFSPSTQLAMSGPSILARTAGADALDETFRAIAEATVGAAARATASEGNAVWSPGMDIAGWLREALARDEPWGNFQARHPRLRDRLAKGPTTRPGEAVRRKDLDRLFPDGYRALECEGIITGEATRGGDTFPVLGLVGTKHLGAERAWRFAEAAWSLAKAAPARAEILLDCESHATSLEDEKAVLTEFIVDMGVALAALAARGTRVELTILERAGGGVYVALASPAARVSVVHGADVQVLPGAAVASILGASQEATADISEYRRYGVADEERRLGLLPRAW